MDIDIKKQPKSVVEFSIKATSDEVAKFFDRAVEMLAKDLKIPGFRPGKVPKDMTEDTIGKQAIENQAKELAINDTYFEMVNQNKLIPLDRPKDVEIKKFSKEEGLEWEGKAEVLPEVEVGDWKEKLKVKSGSSASPEAKKLKMEEVKVEEKEVEDALLTLRKKFAKLEDKKPLGKSGVRSEKGDWVNIDIDIADSDKEKFPKEKIKKFQSKGFGIVIGEASFIPGFEEELVGLEKDSEKEFDITFPANYIDKEIAGKKVKFKIKVNEIKKINLPELNDEFAKNFNKNSAEELRGAIKEDILNQKKQKEKARFEDEVLKEIMKDINIEIPNILIEQEKGMIMERFKNDLEQNKRINFTDYMASIGKSEEEIKNGFSEQAENNVKMGLILGKITKQEKIQVDDKDIEEVMSMDIIRQTAGMPADKVKETENQIRDRYRDDQFINSIKNSILARKTIDVIVKSIEK